MPRPLVVEPTASVVRTSVVTTSILTARGKIVGRLLLVEVVGLDSVLVVDRRGEAGSGQSGRRRSRERGERGEIWHGRGGFVAKGVELADGVLGRGRRSERVGATSSAGAARWRGLGGLSRVLLGTGVEGLVHVDERGDGGAGPRVRVGGGEGGVDGADVGHGD